MKTWIIISSVIITLVVISLLIALKYLGYLSTTQSLLIAGSLLLLGLLVIIVSIFVRRSEDKKDGEVNYNQQISRADAKKLALEMVKSEYTDYLSQFTADEILNIGQSQHNRTPIYHLAGVGRLSKDRYDVLIRLDDAQNKSTILVNANLNVINERIDMLSAAPIQYNKRAIKTVDAFGRELRSEEISVANTNQEQIQEKKEQNLEE